MSIAKRLFPCLLVFALAVSAKADGGDLGLAYLYGYQNFNNVGQRSYNNATPPYFALHPPVYYGQRFARPYGASPFAAWPQLQASAAYAPRVQVEHSMNICNPYVVAAANGVAPSVVATEPIQPLVIDNPYYTEGKVQFTSK